MSGTPLSTVALRRSITICIVFLMYTVKVHRNTGTCVANKYSFLLLSLSHSLSLSLTHTFSLPLSLSRFINLALQSFHVVYKYKFIRYSSLLLLIIFAHLLPLAFSSSYSKHICTITIMYC